VLVDVGPVELEGSLVLPDGATGLVVFAHGSGSSRHSSRNRFVANELNRAGLGTFLFDLLTAEEERIDMMTRRLRFDINMLAVRVVGAIDWLGGLPETEGLGIGLFGASTGAAAALMAAARRPDAVRVVVSRGGRPDLAATALPSVKAPTLLIVGGEDYLVIEMNRTALDMMEVEERRLVIVPGATHLFEEPGALEEVARLASEWFVEYLH
jgi:dienelactone hydrolase